MSISVSLWISGSIWAENRTAFYVRQVDERRRPVIAHKREQEEEEKVQGALKNIPCCVGRRSSQIPWQFRFFFPGPAFAIWYSNAEETGGELLPDHPQYHQGLVKEHQLGQQDAGPVHVQGDAMQSTHTHSRVSLVLPVLPSLSLSNTHMYTQTRRGSHAYAVTCFPILWQLSKNNSKIPLDFCVSQQVGMG